MRNWLLPLAVLMSPLLVVLGSAWYFHAWVGHAKLRRVK